MKSRKKAFTTSQTPVTANEKEVPSVHHSEPRFFEIVRKRLIKSHDGATGLYHITSFWGESLKRKEEKLLEG